MGIRLDQLPPGVISRAHVLPAMKDGQTVRLTVGQILDLIVDAAPDELDTLKKLAAAVGNDPNFAATVSAERLKFLKGGLALPSSNIGPIWHADYDSIMTWRVFSANGASYAGYASVEIGTPRLDGQSTARAGFLKRNGGSYSKTAYAALWNWALHNGRVVSLGSWAPGAFVFTDNGDGTFKVPDNRGEFERIWDDGRGVDSGRVFGSYQADEIRSHRHDAPMPSLQPWRGNVGTSLNGGNPDTSGGYMTGYTGGSETRPRSVALLGTIKF